MRSPFNIALTLTLLLANAACRPAAEQPVEGLPATASADGAAASSTGNGMGAPADDLQREALRTYADIVHAAYADSLAAARDLTRAIDAFLAAPDAATLELARQAWVAGDSRYSRTEVFRFYEGPIDAPETGPEGRINSWPLDEAYLDYVEGQPDAGLVNATTEHPDLTAELLVRLNTQGAETHISTGWHAIEFLLWGQDQRADGAGDRPVTDYVVGQGAGAERRRQLLKLLATQLEADLQVVVAAWDPQAPDTYRSAFLALPPQEALGKVLTGMGSLSGAELAGERLTVPFSTQEQEEEINCFSDTTVVALVGDQEGIANVWRGAFGDVDGPGVDDLLRAGGHADLAARLDAAVAAAQEALGVIPAPFDQAILGAPGSRGALAIEAALAALDQQTDLLGQAATALGVQVQQAD